MLSPWDNSGTPPLTNNPSFVWFLPNDLRLLHYKLQYCSRYTIDRESENAITYWCYDRGLKTVLGGLQFELVRGSII